MLSRKAINFTEFLQLLKDKNYPKAVGFATSLDIYKRDASYHSYIGSNKNFFIEDLAAAYSEEELAQENRIIYLYDEVSPLLANEELWLKTFLTPYWDRLEYVQIKGNDIAVAYTSPFGETSIIAIPKPNPNWGGGLEPGKAYKMQELFNLEGQNQLKQFCFFVQYLKEFFRKLNKKKKGESA